MESTWNQINYNSLCFHREETVVGLNLWLIMTCLTFLIFKTQVVKKLVKDDLFCFWNSFQYVELLPTFYTLSRFYCQKIAGKPLFLTQESWGAKELFIFKKGNPCLILRCLFSKRQTFPFILNLDKFMLFWIRYKKCGKKLETKVQNLKI